MCRQLCLHKKKNKKKTNNYPYATNSYIYIFFKFQKPFGMWVARMLQHSVFCMIWMAAVKYGFLSYLHVSVVAVFGKRNTYFT